MLLQIPQELFLSLLKSLRKNFLYHLENKF